MGKRVNFQRELTALGYMKEKSLRELSLLMNDVDKMLSGLIKSLKR